MVGLDNLKGFSQPKRFYDPLQPVTGGRCEAQVRLSAPPPARKRGRPPLRGAAAGRHFANQVHATAFTQQFALASDFKCSIEFIGLFDTVAAMGGLQDLGDVGDDINPGLNL